jgi:lipopolysaccharide export system permease protein
MTSRTLGRYLAKQIYGAVAFVLLGFLGLFAFFDLIHEFGDLDKGNYHLRQVFEFVLLSVPGHAYELFPVAVLIGTLYVLAHLANNSEFTVMRGSGMSPLNAAGVLARTGIAFVVLTFAFGEWIAPGAEEAAQQLKLRAMSTLIGREMRSGLWFKDGRSFINVREPRKADDLGDVRIYEFNKNDQLILARAAAHAVYRGHDVWRLTGVAQTRFTPDGPTVEHYAQAEWRSAVNPALLNVLLVAPDRMSIYGLYRYIRHLAGNHQKTERYAIALWKKLFYPVAVLVMMALALPFAYMQARAGMVGIKVFLGIMLGVLFHMLNSLFSHVGLLRDWPPFAAAALPSAAFLLAAVGMMWLVERR